MSEESGIDAAKKRVEELVARFKHNEADYLRSTYNETQARTEFITPLLEAFGWDVQNSAGQPLAFRDVIEEATVEVGEERLSKKPDYELRLARQRKLFFEAKKPSVRIDRDRAPAFQTRRYGYSASLPISVLTNFHQLAIYDCRPIPTGTDEPHVARLTLTGYEDYVVHFDELWSMLSREAVYSGDFDRQFAVDATRRGAEQFDDYFLDQVRDWRKRLAMDIYSNTSDLSDEELTYAVQLFLSRIVFLRICEDREIEKYETLKSLDTCTAFDGLVAILRRADQFYNSGLFALLDDERLGVRISGTTLMSIIQALYYPQSPYTFSVVETGVLGEIYEQFLCDVITVRDGTVEVVSKPEIREGGGVVPTPSFIANRIVERTLGPAIEGKSPRMLDGFTVADICCGSGIFLLSAYAYLLGYYLNWYMTDGPANHAGRRIYETGHGIWRLTFQEKRRILLEHLRGVDIDSNAVEIAQFSLLLKLIEDESRASLADFVTAHGNPALPLLSDAIRCGNSLVSPAEWRKVCGATPATVIETVNPLAWTDEFRTEMANGGFNVIVGNPPYIRIQKMVTYSQKECAYYQHDGSPYSTASQDNFDKYALFVERSLSLVRSDGRVGMIVPHKFMSIHGGRALRTLLADRHNLEEIVHFGVKQVFGRGISNYTCIVIMDQTGADSVRVERAGPLEEWRYGQEGSVSFVRAEELGVDPWEFSGEEARVLFSRIRDQFPVPLSEIAHIEVGVQTSADDVYILRETSSDAATITVSWNGGDWRIERDILQPCLHDVSLSAYIRPAANTWIIYPYELLENTKGKVRARLMQPDEIAERYPGCWNYLCARREELEERSIAGGLAAERQWYQYGRSQSLTKFDRPKIIFPVLSREARCTYDEANTLFTGGGNGPYYMVRARDCAEVSTLYLLAILNHPLSEAFVRTLTSPFRGGYYSHGKQFIENLPIPVPNETKRTEIEVKTAELIAVFDQFTAARTEPARKLKHRVASELRNELDQVVCGLFDLSTEDMLTIDAVPIPS